ncbi:MAG: LPS assembly lipoprotein LptE [Methylococcales bacterium]
MNSKLFQHVLLAICVTWMSGCGLRLKGSETLSINNKRIYVSGIPVYNAFVRQLQKYAVLSGGAVVTSLDESDVHLHVIDQRQIRREISLSQRGKANEYALTFELIFEVFNKDHVVLMPQQSIVITRDYFNPQVQVLGKANEEETIWQEIYKTSVNNFLQRLDVAIKKPLEKDVEPTIQIKQ